MEAPEKENKGPTATGPELGTFLGAAEPAVGGDVGAGAASASPSGRVSTLHQAEELAEQGIFVEEFSERVRTQTGGRATSAHQARPMIQESASEAVATLVCSIGVCGWLLVLSALEES